MSADNPEKLVNSSKIVVVQASVLDIKADVIVNAANESLLGGGGVDGAIHDAAGPELLEECRKLNGCRTGEAKLTKAYKIKNATAIIHTVGPIYEDEETSAPLLSACYWNCLELAAEKGYGSIAFPGISTGVYGYPLDEAARVALSTIIHWLDEHPDVEMNVYLCCFREREKVTYDKVMKGAQS